MNSNKNDKNMFVGNDMSLKLSNRLDVWHPCALHGENPIEEPTDY